MGRGLVVRYERSGAAAVVTIDRPERRNAVDGPTAEALAEAYPRFVADDEARVLVLTGEGDQAFCAGADVAEVLDHDGQVARMELFTRFYAAVEAFPAPTVAVCVGNVVGAGAELAAGCDLRVGGDNLKLAWVGAKMGAPVGPARLVPLVGLSRAKQLIFGAKVVGMEEADRLGLLAATAPAAEAEDAALALARQVAEHDPESLRRLKRMFRELEGTERRVAYENDLLVEVQRAGGGLRTRP